MKRLLIGLALVAAACGPTRISPQPGCALFRPCPVVTPAPVPEPAPDQTPQTQPVVTLPALHVEGKRILTPDGQDWRYGFVTDFRLFQRFLNEGEPVIHALIADRKSLGSNVNGVRVLLMADNIFKLHPNEYPDYLPKLDAFLDLLNGEGFRCECTVFADALTYMPDQGQQHAWLDQVAAVLARHPNAVGELCNECDLTWSGGGNGVDPLAFARPVGSILWERGSSGGDAPPFLPPWDLIGDHPGRVAEWPRRANCRDIITDTGVPCVENEPMGAAEVARSGRSSDVFDFLYWGAVAGLETNGSLFHSDAGLQSELYGPVQHATGVAFFQGLNFAPAAASWWPYRRGGLTGESASCIAHDDALALRTFSKSDGSTCWSVAIRPQPGWTAIGVDGWTVTQQPFPGLVVAVR